jgi:hypothetical protein
MSSSPYVVRSGDYLTAIAARNGTTVDEILALPKNADLKKKRHPEILAPTDIVYLPDVTTKPLQLKTGQTNTFVANVPKVTINVTLLDNDGTALANKPVTTAPPVTDDPLSTDGNGSLTFDVTIDVRTVWVSGADCSLQFQLCIGNLDPSDTDTGLASRLRHMGHLGDEDPYVASRDWMRCLGEGFRGQALACGVAAFQADNGLDVTGEVTDDVRDAIKDKHGC